MRDLTHPLVLFFLTVRSSVPYDNYLPFVFQGEEILQTIRGFSFGYDFYAPLRNVAFHIYATRENKEKRLKIPKFTENIGRFGREVQNKGCEFRDK